ncbi:MAG: copper chaperone PCu(A)C, partial [Anaerolineae bacterium]|nr:copper chaperone PCu(A)C [Anaerolineae bacterium]
MKRLKYLSLVLLLLLSSAVMAQGESAECQLSYLFNAWARAANVATPNSAVYGQLVHIGGMGDTLVSASSDVAEAVELHEMTMGAGDVMQMRPVEGGFVIPADGFVELAPGGFHIMLIGLKQELVAGEHIDLTLNFEQAGAVQLTVPIKDADAMEGMDMSESMDMNMAEGDAMGDMSMMDWGDACVGLYFLDPWARPAV